MGKATGFMELDRIEKGYEPVEDRVKHFKEFLGLHPGKSHPRRSPV